MNISDKYTFRPLPPGVSYPSLPKPGDEVEVVHVRYGPHLGTVVSVHNGSISLEVYKQPGDPKQHITLMTETLRSPFHQEWSLVGDFSARKQGT